ncbi:UNVERIFIED_CONTAM: uncharacterized protein DUF2276 [Acetivibrio alkalicellulosi]
MMHINIPYNQITINLRALAPAKLPPFLGSTLRGSLGMALKKLLCQKDILDDCQICNDFETCKYTYLFTNKVKSQGIDGHECISNLPNPFVLRTPLNGKKEYFENDLLSFDMVIIGDAKKYVQLLFQAFRFMGENGLGAYRAPFVFESAYDTLSGRTIYTNGKLNIECLTNTEWSSIKGDACNELKIGLDTPLRLKSEGQIVKGISFELFISSITRRLESLYRLYCDRDYISDMKIMSKGILVKKADLRLFHINRYSNREYQKQQLSGIMGSISFCGDLTEYLPYLKGGEIFHVGKFVTMGLGRFHIRKIG